MGEKIPDFKVDMDSRMTSVEVDPIKETKSEHDDRESIDKGQVKEANIASHTEL
jgi:hypothetical protein